VAAIYVAVIGGTFTLLGIILPLIISRRRTRKRVIETKATFEATESKILDVDTKGTQMLGLLERMLDRMTHQDERAARNEEQMNKVLTRLGRIESRQKQDHTRITQLEEDNNEARRRSV
jgi:hypothetical protein